jgi:mannose-6-phosphate isomerase-like protein (cupin superfamily)
MEKIKEVEKVWGREIWIENDSDYCVKELHLVKGAKCSYHYHKKKKETFFVVYGAIELVLDSITHKVTAGGFVTVEREQKHSFKGLKHTLLIECSTEHFEDDSYRLTESKA